MWAFKLLMIFFAMAEGKMANSVNSTILVGLTSWGLVVDMFTQQVILICVCESSKKHLENRHLNAQVAPTSHQLNHISRRLKSDKMKDILYSKRKLGESGIVYRSIFDPLNCHDVLVSLFP